jgi:hypothetical protein
MINIEKIKSISDDIFKENYIEKILLKRISSI